MEDKITIIQVQFPVVELAGQSLVHQGANKMASLELLARGLFPRFSIPLLP